MDILQQSAQAWKEITEYHYLFTYGYKKKLYPINLTFSLEDYPHLAGFQYMILSIMNSSYFHICRVCILSLQASRLTT